MSKNKAENQIKDKEVSKGPRTVRDIKPRVNMKQSFKVRHLEDDQIVKIDPLVEDDDSREDNDDNFSRDAVSPQVSPPKINVTSLNNMNDTELAQEIEKIMPELKLQDSRAAYPEELAPREIIKVKFVKFAALVANHDFSEVIASHADEDVIISSNLLTELASARDKGDEKKIPIVFIVGIAIGIVLTYIFFSK